MKTVLIFLDTKEIVPKCVVEAVSGAKMKGQPMYDKYVEERLISGPNPSQILYNDATYLCLPPLKNASHVRQVIKVPISRVTANSSPGCILLAKQERETSKNFSSICPQLVY